MHWSLLQTADGGTDWPEAMIAVGGIAMVTIIAAIAIWQVLASWRARMSVAREEAYRKLAEESNANQERVLAQQQTIATDLSGLREKVEGIEKMLRDVG
jgi:hypothetical protein